jgi:hypothetical protein
LVKTLARCERFSIRWWDAVRGKDDERKRERVGGRKGGRQGKK